MTISESVFPVAVAQLQQEKRTMSDPVTFNECGAYSLKIAQLKATVELFEKHIRTEDLDVFVMTVYSDALDAINDALAAMTCQTCNEAVSVNRQAGRFCQKCSDLFTECAGCSEDVKLSDAVTPAGMESGFYHGPCCPDTRASVTHSEKLDAIAPALVAIQSALKPVARNVQGEDGKPYADLSAVWKHVKPLLRRHKIAVVQFGGAVEIETLLLHESGQWIASVAKCDSRANGETAYGQRFALMLALGVVQQPEPAPPFGKGEIVALTNDEMMAFQRMNSAQQAVLLRQKAATQ